MKADIVYDIWLALAAGQSIALPRQLLEQFGSAKVLYENRLSLREAEIRLTGEERKQFETLSLARPERIAEQCERDGTQIVALPDEGYPERLREIYDPPAVLYLRGNIDQIDLRIGNQFIVAGADLLVVVFRAECFCFLCVSGTYCLETDRDSSRVLVAVCM